MKTGTYLERMAKRGSGIHRDLIPQAPTMYPVEFHPSRHNPTLEAAQSSGVMSLEPSPESTGKFGAEHPFNPTKMQNPSEELSVGNMHQESFQEPQEKPLALADSNEKKILPVLQVQPADQPSNEKIASEVAMKPKVSEIDIIDDLGSGLRGSQDRSRIAANEISNKTSELKVPDEERTKTDALHIPGQKLEGLERVLPSKITPMGDSKYEDHPVKEKPLDGIRSMDIPIKNLPPGKAYKVSVMDDKSEIEISVPSSNLGVEHQNPIELMVRQTLEHKPAKEAETIKEINNSVHSITKKIASSSETTVMFGEESDLEWNRNSGLIIPSAAQPLVASRFEVKKGHIDPNPNKPPIVNVSIGAIEIKAEAPQATSLSTEPSISYGFGEYTAMRRYVSWERSDL